MTTAREEPPSSRRNNPYETGEGGGFGKLRKKPFRRSHQATPYDRPPATLRNPASNNAVNGWLSKLVDPAQRFITYSAHRLFDSVFRKRLPAPTKPLVEPEADREVRDEHKPALSKDPNVLLGRATSGPGNPSTNSDHGGLTELELILRQKTFTRSEIDHLTSLLHSRTVDLPMGNDGKRPEVISMKQTGTCDRTEEFPKTPAKENFGSYLASPLATHLQVLDEDSASPAEIAKAYMGSVPSKVSPSMLGLRGQALREDLAVLNSRPKISESPTMALVPRPSGHVGIAENGFVTPRSRSRGRSAIYSMARTPYIRLQSPASVKSTGPAPSSSQSAWEQSRLSGSRQGGVKRRSSFLDSDIGSAGPIRRIRQKSNFLPHKNLTLPVSGTPLSTHGTVIVSERPSSSTQKPLSLGESKHYPTENGASSSGACFAPVSSKTSEMATRILEQLDKLVSPMEKSPSKLSPSMLRGPALKSLENIDTSHVLENTLGDSKKDDVPSTSRDTQLAALRGKSKFQENDPTISQAAYSKSAPALNGAQITDLSRNNLPEARIANSKVMKSALPPKRGFQMSALEDYLDLDEDDHSNGVTTTSLAEGRNENTQTVEMEKKKAIISEANTMEKPLGNSLISFPNQKVALLPAAETAAPAGKSVSFAFSGGASSSATAQPQSTPISNGFTPVKESNTFPVNGKKDTLPKEQNSPPPSLLSHSSKGVDVAPQLTITSSSSTVSESLGSKLTASSDPKVVISSRFASVAEVTESDKTDTKNIPKNAPMPESTLSFGVSASSPAPAIFAFGSASSNSSLTNGSSASISTFSAAPHLVSNNVMNGGNSISTVTFSDKGSDINSLSNSAVLPSVSDTPIFKFGSSVAPSTSVAASFSAAPSAEPTETKTKETSFGKLTSNPFDGTSAIANTSGVNFGSGSATVAGRGSSIFGGSSSAITSTSSNLVGSTISSTSSLFGLSMPTTGNSIFGDTSAAISSNTSNVFCGTSSAISNTSSNPFTGTTSSISDTGASLFSFGASAPKSQSEGSAPSSSTGNSQGIVNGSGITSSTQSIPIQFGAPFSSASPFGSSSSTASLFSSGTVFGSNSTMSNSVSSNSSTTSTLFGSNWQAPKSPVSGSPFRPAMFGSAPASTSSTVAMFGSSTIGASSSSPSTGFSFGASSASSGASSTPAMFGSAPASTVSTVAMFGSSTIGASSSSVFSFASTAPATASSQSVFGNTNNNSPFSLSSGPAGNNNDQMSMEDSMAEDTVQAATVPVFGQQPSSFMFGSAAPPGANPSVSFGSAAPPGANPFGSAAAPFGVNPSLPFGSTAPPPGVNPPSPFGSTAPSVANPFQFGGQQNPNPNPSPFQASGSLEFNAGGTGSFSLGSGGGDKSGRKIVKVNRSKHRKK